MRTWLIPVASLPVPDAVKVKLVTVAGALPRLVNCSCNTGTLVAPGTWLEPGLLAGPTLIWMVSGVGVPVGVTVRVFVGVEEGVFVKVEVKVGLGVLVGVLVNVGVMTSVLVGVGVIVGVWVKVWV